MIGAPVEALHDVELADRVLAELADPLHPGIPRLGELTADEFYDHAHQRIARVLLARRASGLPPIGRDVVAVRHLLSPSDFVCLRDAVRFAWPLTAGGLESFLDLARRRRRLGELDRERAQLVEGAA